MAVKPKRAYSIFSGGFAMVAGCNHCSYILRVERPPKPGKAWGWTARNELTRKMNLHIKEKHIDSIKSAI